MTNQSQPLTLKLSTGKEVSVPTGKSILQFTENGQPRSCAIVRGPKGVAVYNAEGDVQINGAPSSVHWLQPGDEIRFGENMSASIEQLGVVSEALDSLLYENESTQPVATAPELTPATPTPVAPAQDSFTPATEATAFVLEPQAAADPATVQAPASFEAAPTAPAAPVADAQGGFKPATEATAFVLEPQTPAPAPVQAPVAAPAAPVADALESFKPATEATAFVLEPQTAAPASVQAPVPTPIEAPAVADAQDTFVPATAANAPEATSTGAPSSVMDLATPAVTAAALAASAMSVAGAFQGEPNSPADSQPVPAEPAGFNPVTSALETVAASVTPATEEAPAIQETPTAPPEISGFAADLLARIQADENENETVGATTSETTHSPLAADGYSFSSPTLDNTQEASNSISSLIPELPPISVPAPAVEAASAINPEPATPGLVETTTAESSERQEQSSSVSALLERMKSEGQWDTEAEAEETSEPEAPAPAFAEADEDVQSYMSQLLTRMRDPNAEPPKAAPAAAAVAPKPEPKQVIQQVVEPPKPVGLLKPEEFVPKNKAKRLDSLQDMRALANTQTRTAVDRSQAKREEAVKDSFYLAIAIASCILAALVFFFNIFGSMSFVVGMVAMAVGAFFCYKTYFSDPVKSSQNKKKQPQAAQEPAQEVV